MSKYSRKLIEQKLVGVGFLLLCTFMFVLALEGKTVEDRDCTLALLLAPLGVYLLVSKEVCIY